MTTQTDLNKLRVKLLLESNSKPDFAPNNFDFSTMLKGLQNAGLNPTILAHHLRVSESTIHKIKAGNGIHRPSFELGYGITRLFEELRACGTNQIAITGLVSKIRGF